ncbi:hypothetical protein CPB85DRAFT_1359029 [Mucidula mucida]|nr:hypothetical protein CPB85DRAFT_1365562 [Mucidula mucida]KAF8869334.1 hypothetical protein CPB85DRAFT_1359029 [Mucidula mucida]
MPSKSNHESNRPAGIYSIRDRHSDGVWRWVDGGWRKKESTECNESNDENSTQADKEIKV